jgi:hypothetical protein
MFTQPPDIDRRVVYVRDADSCNGGNVSGEIIMVPGIQSVVWEKTVVANEGLTEDCSAPRRKQYAVIRGRRNLSLHQEPESESRMQRTERGPSLNVARLGFTKLKTR